MATAPALARRNVQGYRFGKAMTPVIGTAGAALTDNPLHGYFDAHQEGSGILKWRHYLDVYHRHLSKFIGREINVLEIGVYSGGSLEMWREYFGPFARIYGADIEPACTEYEDRATGIFIGDQAEGAFSDRVLREVAAFDVVIDDGGHWPYQQVATLEALLGHMNPGGVYVCEDVHGPSMHPHAGAGRSMECAHRRRCPCTTMKLRQGCWTWQSLRAAGWRDLRVSRPRLPYA